ncbi:MAG: hypothetical protein KGJ40_04640 [candidate division NC10 bacterium]|nr:hypothetical protein [candidate division NC10 bacterium]
MKRAEGNMRREYKRSDFSKLERGKFYAEVAKGTSVALLEPSIAKAFPTSRAVNEALSGLLELTKKTSRITRRPTRTRAKTARVAWQHVQPTAGEQHHGGINSPWPARGASRHGAGRCWRRSGG